MWGQASYGNSPILHKDQLPKEGKRKVTAHTSHLFLPPPTSFCALHPILYPHPILSPLFTSSCTPSSLPVTFLSPLTSSLQHLQYLLFRSPSVYHLCGYLSPILLVSSLRMEVPNPGAFLFLESPAMCCLHGLGLAESRRPTSHHRFITKALSWHLQATCRHLHL